MKNLLWQIKEFGIKVALQNALISFTKWVLGAKRIRISYFRK